MHCKLVSVARRKSLLFFSFADLYAKRRRLARGYELQEKVTAGDFRCLRKLPVKVLCPCATGLCAENLRCRPADEFVLRSN